MARIDITDIAADIDTCRRYIKNHQHNTIECVAFLPTGKVSIVEKERLESLNSEVDRLKGLVEHNSGVHEALSKLLTPESTVQLAREHQRRIEKSIAGTENLFRIDLGNLIKFTYGIDPLNPFDHPKAKDLKEKTDAKIAALRSDLAAVNTLIAEAEKILQDFQPSGLQPMPASTAPAIISREKVSGFGV